MLSTDPKTKGSSKEVTEKEFTLFIAYNAEDYLKEFQKFNIYGVDRYRLTWNWPAFLLTYIWMASRKMYFLASVVFVITYFFAGLIHPIWFVNVVISIFISSEVPIVLILYNILLMFLIGITGNYIYYRHAKKKILNLKTKQKLSDSHEISVALQKEGGLNWWIIIIAPTLLVLFLIYPWVALI